VTDIVTIGESLGVLRAAPPDAVDRAASLSLGIGGAESNVAIGASRLGADVRWIGRVGDDDLGLRVIRELRAEGVRVDAVVDASAPTGLLIKETPLRGPSRVRYYRSGSAGSRLRPQDLPAGAIAGSRLLHLTGITPSLSPSSEETVSAALEEARAAGVPVSFDVNHRSTLVRHRDAAEIYRDIARRATVVFAGDDEARLLVPLGRTEDELLDGIAALGPTEVVLKLGARGCVALIEGTRHHLDAVPARVVDTVGAGDAFVAGYLAERMRGLLAPDRLETAVRCGALVCEHPGDWEGAPRRRDLRTSSAGDPVIR
jgi:2-dehydro-3-deoxygluconokinase